MSGKGSGMQVLSSGAVIHGHTLIERIGGGHYGEVWRAEYLGQPVALKIFQGDRKPSHLQREAFAQYALGRMAGGDARFFPRVEHLDLVADPPYLRMELVDGTPLETLLAHAPLPLESRLSIGESILRALAAVHRAGFVHGDLSPLNVLVATDRSVRLIDVGFGALFPTEGDIAVSTTEEDRPSGVASPLYAAPERFQAGAEGCGPASDLFSFGKVLYRMITGEPPFVIKPVSRKFPALGPKWDDFLFRCLEEKPGERFPDAESALTEYRRINRPELAPGEFRAECPECKAAHSIPGGWAGERFECRSCGRALEVLFYDDASRYATTALAGSEGPPPILILDDVADRRTKKFCPQCGRETQAQALKCPHCRAWVNDAARRVVEISKVPPLPIPSYWLPVLFTLFGYCFLWLPGVLLNWFYLEDAQKARKQHVRKPPGMGALQFMRAAFCFVPLGFGIAVVSLMLIGRLLLNLAR